MGKILCLFLALSIICVAALPGQRIDIDEIEAEENFRWGVRAFHSGYFSDAVLSLEKSLSYKSSKILPRLWLGRALYKSGYEEAALNEWKYILESGQGDSLLKNKVQALSYRRGLGRELEQRTWYVISNEINANQVDYYPLRRPSSVHVRQDGTVYIVAFGTDEVVMLDVNNQVQNVLKGGLKGFDRPFDCLEVEDPGMEEKFLFISEYGRNQIIKCTLQGKRIREFGGMGSDPGMLLGPMYLAADGKGYIYVSDWGNARVNKYDLDGNFVLSIGDVGASLYSLSGPTGIAVMDDLVYVADRSQGRIAVFDLSGNYLNTFGEEILSGPEGITFKNPGTLLIADGNRVLEFHLNKEIWKTLSDISSYSQRLTHIAFSPNGELYAVDFDLNKIFILSEMSSLYTGLRIQVERIVSTNFPEIIVDLSVEDRMGYPLVGLEIENFVITEHFVEVMDPSLVRSNTDPAPLEVVVIVEKSQQMKKYISELTSAIETIYSQLAGIGALQIISAGDKAVLETDFGVTRLEAIRAATRPSKARQSRFDLGARTAASQLIPRHSRKAVIFLTQGRLVEGSFDEYSLAEVTHYLCNNFIGFYTIVFGPEGPAGELEYICAETGGKSYNYFAPGGIERLVSDISSQVSPVYTIKFLSISEPGFGQVYIDLQVEATLQRKSGRDESGYFSPLTD